MDSIPQCGDLFDFHNVSLNRPCIDTHFQLYNFCFLFLAIIPHRGESTENDKHKNYPDSNMYIKSYYEIDTKMPKNRTNQHFPQSDSAENLAHGTKKFCRHKHEGVECL